MNDQMLMDNYLLILKSTVEVYVHGTLESSNEDTRSLLKDCLNEILSMQADTYDKMTENGWYNIDNVEVNTITQTLTKLQNKSSDNGQDDSSQDDDYEQNDNSNENDNDQNSETNSEDDDE